MDVERFLIKLNKVTADHRHGVKVSKEKLDALCDAQLDLEAFLRSNDTFSRECDCCGRIMKPSFRCPNCDNEE